MTPATRDSSPRVRLVAGAALALGLACLLPTPASAGIGGNPVAMTVSFGSSAASPGDTLAFVRLTSLTGLPVFGEVYVNANSLLRQVDSVYTTRSTTVTVNLGNVKVDMLACASFQGFMLVDGDSADCVQSAACGELDYVAPPEPVTVALPAPRPYSGVRLPTAPKR